MTKIACSSKELVHDSELLFTFLNQFSHTDIMLLLNCTAIKIIIDNLTNKKGLKFNENDVFNEINRFTKDLEKHLKITYNNI